MKMRVVYKRTSFNFLRHVIIEEKKEISREKEADQITLNTEQTSIYPCLDFCSDINVKTYMYECLVLSHVYFHQYLLLDSYLYNVKYDHVACLNKIIYRLE